MRKKEKQNIYDFFMAKAILDCCPKKVNYRRFPAKDQLKYRQQDDYQDMYVQAKHLCEQWTEKHLICADHMQEFLSSRLIVRYWYSGTQGCHLLSLSDGIERYTFAVVIPQRGKGLRVYRKKTMEQ